MPMITGGFRNHPPPTDYPTYLLSYAPTALPTTSPNQNPTDTIRSSILPSISSSILPSIRPSVSSSMEPSILASDDPSNHPSEQPSNTPSNPPSTLPPNMSTSHPTTPTEPSAPFKSTYPPSNFPSKFPSTDDPTSTSSSIIQRMEQPPNQYGRKPSRNQSRFPPSPRQPSSANVPNPSTPTGSFTSKPTRSRGRVPSRDNNNGRHDSGGKDAKKKGSKPDKNSHANTRKDGDKSNQHAELEHVPGSNSSGPSFLPSSAPSAIPSAIPSLNSSASLSLLPSLIMSTKNGTTNKLMAGNSTFTKHNNTELSPSWQPTTFKPTNTTVADNATSPEDENTTATQSYTSPFSPPTMKPSSRHPSQSPSMRPKKVEPPSVYPSQFPSVAPSAVPPQEPTVGPSIGSTLGSTVNSTSISFVAGEAINESELKGEKNGSTKVSFTLKSSQSNGESSKNSTSSQGENGPHNSQQQGGVSVVKENENSGGEQYEGYNVLDVKEFEDEDNNIEVIINLEHLDSQSPNAVPTSSMEAEPSSGGLTNVPTSLPSPQVSQEEVVVPEEAPLKMVFNIGPRDPPSPTPASSPNEISDSSNEKSTKVAMGEYGPAEYSNNDEKGSEEEETIKMEFDLGPRHPPSPNSAPSFREPTTPSYNGPTKVSVGDYEAKEVKRVEDVNTLITFHRGKVTMKMGPDVADDEKYKYPTYYPTYIPTDLVEKEPSVTTTFHKDILIPKSPPEREDRAPSFAVSSEKRGSSSSKVNFNMSFVSSETREENNGEDSAEKTQTTSTTFVSSASSNEKEKETSTVVNVEKRGSSSSKVNFKIPFVSSKTNEEKSDDGKDLEQTFSTSASSFSASTPDANKNTPSTVATVDKRESSTSKVNTKLSYNSLGEFVGNDKQNSEENFQTWSTAVAYPTFPTSFPTYLIFPTMSPSNEHVSSSRSESASLKNSIESPSTLNSSEEPTQYVLPTPDVPGTPWPTYIPTAHEYLSPQRNSPFVSRPSGGYSRPTSSYTSRNSPSQAMGAEGSLSPFPSPSHTTAEPTYYVYPTYYPTTWFPTYIPTSQEPASVTRTSPYGGQPFFVRPTSTNQDRKPPSQEQSTQGPELAKDLSRSALSPHPTFLPTFFTTTNQNINSTLNFKGSSPHEGDLDIVPGYQPTPTDGYPVAIGAKSAAPTPFVDSTFSWTWAPSFDGKNEENATSEGEDDDTSAMVVHTPSDNSSLHWTWAPTISQNESSTTSAYEDNITPVAPSALNESYEEAISSLFEKRFCPGFPFGIEPSSQKENVQVLFAYGVQTNREVEQDVAFLQALILDDVASSLLRCFLQTKKSLRDNHPDEIEQYASRVYYENDGSFYTLSTLLERILFFGFV